LADVTPGDADDFSRWLAMGARRRGKADPSVKGLSPATVGKRLQWCSIIFKDATRRKLLTENPFSGVKQPKASNPERQQYVNAETIETLIESTPDREWKLLLACSRYLGLRVPSEPFSMMWADVDWEKSRIKIRSPKTEHLAKPFRVVPILPEVRPHLERCFAETPDGAVYVFDRLRQRDSQRQAANGFRSEVNMRQYLLRLLSRASILPWPRLWHNLRSSAQTDLANRFPMHTVCDWLGNTTAIAQQHYSQVTEQHFEQAVAAQPSDTKSDSSPHQNQRVTTRTDTPEMKKPLVSKGFQKDGWRVGDLNP
jgi:integrase